MRRRLRKLVVLVVVAGVTGSALGIGVATLTRDDTERQEAAGPRTAADAAAQAIRVRVLDAVLHPAKTPSGQARRRARLTVRIRARNRRDEPVTPARPRLVIGDARIATDHNADAPATHLGTLAAGKTAAVTLRFEVGEAITERLASQRRARIHVAGRTLSVSVKLGRPPHRAATADEAR